MRVRTAVALAAMLAVAGGAYWAIEVRGREAREAAAAAERRVLHFDPDAVREVVVEKPGERVVARGEGERWVLVEPEAAAADAPTVHGLLAFVRRLEKVRALGSDGDLAQYGLAEPLVRLRLGLRDGSAVTLALGQTNPVATGVYARVDGAPVLFLAPRELAGELTKRPYAAELRDRRLFPVDVARVRRLEIERAGARIAIERVEERRWRVERPFAGPGDDGIIRDLLWKLGAARSHGRLDAAASPTLGRPHARVRVTDDRDTRTLVLLYDDASGRLLAAAGGGDGVHVTDRHLLDDVAIAPDALRDRQLLVFDAGDVERVTIGYPRDSLVLERVGDRWRVTRPVEGEAVRETVENLLEVLPNLRYTTVEAPPAAPAAYGLDAPGLSLTVGLRGGRELPTLRVGRVTGASHFVMVGRSGPVYTVDSRLLRVIPEDPTDAKWYPLPEQLKRNLDKLKSGKS